MLTSLQKVKFYLDIDMNDSQHDFLLTELIKQASDAVELYCNRKFRKDIYTESVRGVENLWVKNTPIHDVLYLVDTNDNDVNFKFTDKRVLIKKQAIVSITGGIRYREPARGEYIIKYVGGYETIPAAVQQIVTEMVLISFKEIQDDTMLVKSRNEGSVSQTFIDKAIIQDKHKSILDYYKVINI